MILVPGILAIFLAIGISPRLALFLAAGVVAGILVLFLIVKTHRPRREAEANAVPQQAFPGEDGYFEFQPKFSKAEGRTRDDFPHSLPEEINPDALQESIPPEPEDAVTRPQPSPVEKEEWFSIQELSRDEILAQIQESLVMVEKRGSHLKDRIIGLEAKAVSYQTGQLKSEPKVDLQTILSRLDEGEGKAI